LGASGKRRVLITNAHPETYAIKNEHTALGAYLDASYSSHQFDAPKEDPGFWVRFSARERFDPRRTLLVDDNLSVLECARDYGIAWLRAVRCPDSGRPPKDTGEFAAVDRVSDLL
jgi:putative hydrolase of the HAD superfamily